MSPVLPPQLAELVIRRRSQPRTILSFLWGVLTVLVVSLIALAIALIGSDSEWLIGPIIAVVVAIAIGTMIAVLRRSGPDASGLMLTNVSGPEYESIQRTLTLGNSSAGERVEMSSHDDAVIVTSAAQLQSPESSAGALPTKPESRDE